MIGRCARWEKVVTKMWRKAKIAEPKIGTIDPPFVAKILVHHIGLKGTREHENKRKTC